MIAAANCAIWLYGSYARGNADENSDLDVLVVTDPDDHAPALDMSTFEKPPSVSMYAWPEVERMADYGSLFLRHIEREGRPICEAEGVKGRLEAILTCLGPYSLACRDIRGFRVVLSDVESSLKSGFAPLLFEAATLASVIRHASILGCNLTGNPCFSRLEPVYQLADAWGLPNFWTNEFSCLYVYRLYADGRIESVDHLTERFAWKWWGRARALLDELDRRIYG